jgi:Ca-activated chloride channel family protein
MRRMFPVILFALFAYAIFHHRDHARDRHDGDDRTVNTATQNVRSSYALDVRRTMWPPLAEGGNAPTVAALATANYYVVLDGSGSMMSKECGGGTSRIKAAVEATKQFFATAPADANVGLAAFDRRTISERVPLGTGNRDALNAALQDIDAGSATPLLTAIKIGYEKLTMQARLQLGYGEYHLVVVTDGEPDPRSEDPSPIVERILTESPVVLHTVGFCIDADHVLNQPNRMYYASATSPQQLEKSLQAVLAEAPAFNATNFH